MPRGVASAFLGALLLGALSTLGDLVWARFALAHRAALGLAHGALLFLAMGAFVGLLRGRAATGALGGTAVGFLAAAGFYALAPLLGWGAMLPAWMAVWLGFAWLDARLLGGGAGRGETLLRGALAALGSGVAFYAISGIWTEPRPGGPDYPRHLLSWTAAFLPGFLALLLGRARTAATLPELRA